MSGAPTVGTSALVVEHMTGNGPVRALAHAGIAVDGGTSLAIMGPSGCGKSTLLGLLAGLALPTSGVVAVGDTIVSELAERDRVRFRRTALGMVYQADNLLPHLTVEENVGLRLAISHKDGGAGAADATGAALDRLGLTALAARLPDQLSGGQRQRVAVARAVVHRPAVILADEPTGALDDDNARRVIELLSDVHHDIGATLIVVTHDPVVAGYADRVEQLDRPAQPPQPVRHARVG